MLRTKKTLFFILFLTVAIPMSAVEPQVYHSQPEQVQEVPGRSSVQQQDATRVELKRQQRRKRKQWIIGAVIGVAAVIAVSITAWKLLPGYKPAPVPAPVPDHFEQEDDPVIPELPEDRSVVESVVLIGDQESAEKFLATEPNRIANIALDVTGYDQATTAKIVEHLGKCKNIEKLRVGGTWHDSNAFFDLFGKGVGFKGSYPSRGGWIGAPRPDPLTCPFRRLQQLAITGGAMPKHQFEYFGQRISGWYPQLRQLDLSGNDLGDDFKWEDKLEHFARMPRLSTLHVGLRTGSHDTDATYDDYKAALHTGYGVPKKCSDAVLKQLLLKQPTIIVDHPFRELSNGGKSGQALVDDVLYGRSVPEETVAALSDATADYRSSSGHQFPQELITDVIGSYVPQPEVHME